MTAWKDLERRICNALGGRRAGPLGASVSDCVNTPFAVEVKRSSRPGPPVLAQWILQARTNAKRENRPWLVVVAGHNDRRPTATLDFWEFVQIAQQAGRIGTITIEPQETAAKPASLTADRVPPVSVPAGLQRSTAGTATLKGANLKHDTETETTTTTTVEQPEPPTEPPEPEPEPDEPDGDEGQ